MNPDFDDYYERYPLLPEKLQEIESLVKVHVQESMKDVIANNETLKKRGEKDSKEISDLRKQLADQKKATEQLTKEISPRKGFEYLCSVFKISPESMPDPEKKYWIVKRVYAAGQDKVCEVCNGDFSRKIDGPFGGQVEAKCPNCHSGKVTYPDYNISSATVNYLCFQNFGQFNSYDSPRMNIAIKEDRESYSDFAFEGRSLERTLFNSPEDAEAAIRKENKYLGNITVKPLGAR